MVIVLTSLVFLALLVVVPLCVWLLGPDGERRRRSAQAREYGARLLRIASTLGSHRFWVALPAAPSSSPEVEPWTRWDADSVRAWRRVLGHTPGRLLLEGGASVLAEHCDWYVVADEAGRGVDFAIHGRSLPTELTADVFFASPVERPPPSRQVEWELVPPKRLQGKPHLSWTEAKSLVEAELRASRSASDEPLVVLEDVSERLPWGWIIYYATEQYARTRSTEYLLIGAGPYVVDAFTSEVIATGSGTNLKGLIRLHALRHWY